MRPLTSRWRCAMLLGAGTLLPGCVSVSEVMRPGEVRLSSDPVDLPSEWLESRAVATIEARVNGHGPYRFLLDTGANIILVSPRLAERRSAPGRGAVRGMTARDAAGHPGELEEPARFDSVGLGNLELRDVQALVARLDELSAALGVTLDGILGCPAFEDGCLTIDPIGRHVSFTREALPPVDGVAVFPLLSRTTPLVEARIGGETVSLVLDSAHTGGIHLARLPASVPCEALPLPSESVLGPGGDLLSERWSRVRGEFRVGPIALTDPVLLVGDERRQGVVGAKVLRHFRVSIDFANARVAFRGGPAPPVLDAPLGTGATLGPGDGGIRVVRLLPRSPAEEKGLRVGDRVVAVNDLPTDVENEAAIGAFLRRRGTTVRFTVVRGDAPVVIEVPVEDLRP